MAEPYNGADNFVLKGTPETTAITFKAGQGVIPARTPVKRDATSKQFVKTAAADKAEYITVYAVNATNETTAQAYKAGDFNLALINWPDGLDSDKDKQAHLGNLAISVDRPYDL